MDPLFGVPMVQTPPAEIRACLKTQLGLDAARNSDHTEGALDSAGGSVSPEELAIAHRYCSTLE